MPRAIRNSAATASTRRGWRSIAGARRGKSSPPGLAWPLLLSLGTPASLTGGSEGGNERMQKTLLRTLVSAVVLALVCAGVASAIVIRAGNIVVVGDGGFTPTK